MKNGIFFAILALLSVFLFVQAKHQLKRHNRPQSSFTHRLLGTSPDSQDGLQKIYTEWSKWSRCSRRCKQARVRRCNSPLQCGNTALKEERTCTGRRCRSKPFAVLQLNQNIFGKNKNKKTDFRVLSSLQSFVYSAWSEWSPCTRRCKTRRVRVCEVPLFCNENIIKQDALCYVEGSTCEQMYYNRKNGNEKQRNKEESKLKMKTLPGSLKGLECGVAPLARGKDLRIIGGRESLPGRWPWQVVLLNKYKEAFCGATILSPYWVLTAAHCVRKRLKVRAGEHRLDAHDGFEQQISVAKAYIHPHYDLDTVDNDVALLKLKRPLKFNDRVQAACLPSADTKLDPGTVMTIVGWGKDKHTKLFGTDTLKEANVPLVPHEECKEVYNEYFISNNMMCAGYKRGKIDSCAGDSGGPLLHKDPESNKWYAYGITSFGDGCGRKRKYGIYSMVPNYVEWMKNVFLENL